MDSTVHPNIFVSYKMLIFESYTGQRIGLSISIIYLHSNECKLVIEMEDFILVLPYFHKSAIWAHCAFDGICPSYFGNII